MTALIIPFPAHRVRQDAPGHISDRRQRFAPVTPFDLIRENHQLSAEFDVIAARAAELDRQIQESIEFGLSLIRQRSHLQLLSESNQSGAGQCENIPTCVGKPSVNGVPE